MIPQTTTTPQGWIDPENRLRNSGSSGTRSVATQTRYSTWISFLLLFFYDIVQIGLQCRSMGVFMLVVLYTCRWSVGFSTAIKNTLRVSSHGYRSRPCYSSPLRPEHVHQTSEYMGLEPSWNSSLCPIFQGSGGGEGGAIVVHTYQPSMPGIL